MTTQIFKLTGMSCSSCVMHIEGIEDKLPGVNQIDVDFKKQRMIAKFDEAKVNSAQIINAVKAEGYTAVPSAEEPSAKKGLFGWKF